MNEWIPVDERLPEDDELVLTYRPYNTFITEYCIDGEWMGDAPYRKPVTHWMYLPDAPGGE